MTTSDLERIKAWAMPQKQSASDLYSLAKQTVDPRPFLSTFAWNATEHEDPGENWNQAGHFIVPMSPHFQRDPHIKAVMKYYTIPEAKNVSPDRALELANRYRRMEGLAFVEEKFEKYFGFLARCEEKNCI